jgi:hypothetical protein
MLKVVNDLATFRQAREPLTKCRGFGSSEQGQHEPLGMKRRLLTAHVCGVEGNWRIYQVAVCDGVSRAISTAEFSE